MIRIAHVSDLHVLSPAGVEWRKILLNKRITGYANLVLHRGRVFRREYLLRVLEDAVACADHVVVTGDITNLALESEYHEARALLDTVAGRAELTVAPGNHDIYLPSIGRERRFPHYFSRFLVSDLPRFAVDLPAGPYPCVKLRGPLAIIALSSAVPRPPFVAAGYVGKAQLAALDKILVHPEVARRTPVILIHHPPVDGRYRLAQLRDGLVDAAPLRRSLAPLARGLVLCGHLHVRRRCALRTATGALDVICASGAALDHPDPSVRAGYNLYEIDDQGAIITIEARVLDPSGTALRKTMIAERPDCA
ncbi:MAG: metallophosphoesterase family protein [Gemmatimonadales bacterium]